MIVGCVAAVLLVLTMSGCGGGGGTPLTASEKKACHAALQYVAFARQQHTAGRPLSPAMGAVMNSTRHGLPTSSRVGGAIVGVRDALLHGSGFDDKAAALMSTCGAS